MRPAALEIAVKMRLSELIKGTECRVVAGSDSFEVESIEYDSRKVEAGSLYAAIKGLESDGFDFIEDAKSAGAVCVLTSRESPVTGITQLVVEDVREALARLCEKFYGEPTKRLTLVGITGTNGKTTTAYILESIINLAGFGCGVVGTVNYRYGDKVMEAERTTPEAPVIAAMLKEMADEGSTHCVMEVSSHALSQRRVDGCDFRTALFTNLTHEHLDYHESMEEYYLAKERLFTELSAEGAVRVINIDDPWGRRLALRFPDAVTYGLSEGAGIHPKAFKSGATGLSATLASPWGELTIESPLCGNYNLLNIMGAAGVALSLGLSRDQVSAGVAGLSRVPGRLERVEGRASDGDFSAYVDYAHTPDALERALGALRPLTEGRLISLFGCGGDRDRSKRAEMGEVSGKCADITILTSDNPRTEDPLEILKDIEEGTRRHQSLCVDEPGPGCYMVVPERGEAIVRGVEISRRGDTLLLAGKGHEDYQIVGKTKHHFDDMEELVGAINKCGARGVRGGECGQGR